jgi:hypothetical protein
LPQLVGLWQLKLILRNKNFVAQASERIRNVGFVFACTENQPYGIIFTRQFCFCFCPIKIKVHLAGIGMREVTDFEVDEKECLPNAVEK